MAAVAAVVAAVVAAALMAEVVVPLMIVFCVLHVHGEGNFFLGWIGF